MLIGLAFWQTFRALFSSLDCYFEAAVGESAVDSALLLYPGLASSDLHALDLNHLG